MSNKVEYYLNSFHFRDNGIYISESDGLLGSLKPKKIETQEWAEYHGEVLTPNYKPKFEPREIELSGWVEGENWLQMKRRFDRVMSEFRKQGKQRLVVNPFGMQPLVYDVVLTNEIDLDKSFRKGFMIGKFKIKLKDLNPIKKVVRVIGNDIHVQFNSLEFVEMKLNNQTIYKRGNVNQSFTIPESEMWLDENNETNNFLTISGDIDSITNFVTNGEELVWQIF